MELKNITIGKLLDDHAENTPNKIAAVFCKSSVRYTWSELNSISNKAAKAFISIGLKKGDHVAVWGTNVPEWLITQMAAAKLGAVLITINPEWKEAELEYALRQSDSKFLVMIDGFEKKSKYKTHKYDYLSMIRNLCPELDDHNQSSNGTSHYKSFPELREIILISDMKTNMCSWRTFLELGNAVNQSDLDNAVNLVRPTDTSMIQYTSGTTGFPKGAMLSHFGTVNNALAAADHMKLTSEDVVCGPVPYYHCFGSILFSLGCLVTGACMVIPNDIFDPHKTLEAIDAENCTSIYGVPTMFITELEDVDFDAFRLDSLRTGIMAGAPVDKELIEAVANKMGANEITIAYGLTEASPVTHQTDIHDSTWHRVNTVGKPIEHTEAKIVNPESLQECTQGEVGEIWVKGYNVMSGYYKKPEETEKSLVDGWLRTGDLGFVTEEGYFRISGRLKEMIIVGGHNVYPAEVEQSLHSLLEDKTELLQIVGVPDHKLQEVVALVVKCLPGQSLTLEEVKKRCDGKLEWPKIPRYLKIVDDLTPFMTVTGKMQKFKLKEMLQEEFALMA